MLKPQKFGQYVMVKRLSTGGMAEVFLTKAAGVKGFEKIVAIKRILPWASEDDEFTTMFIDEAKISSRLSHANIAQVLEFGKENGQYFLAMEYIPGQDLKSIRQHLEGTKESVPVPMVLHVGARLCQALDYAHQLKAPDGDHMELIHRDVSPPNVIVSYDGGVKLIDFGIAKASARATRTRAGRLKGKIAYMSPEQVQGISIDHRSDIFSLGILLYELLTMRDLFHGKNQIDTMNQVRRAEVVPPSTHNPDVPPEVDAIVLKALARERDQRYGRASKMREDIQRYLVRSRTVFGTNHLAEWMQTTFDEEVAEEQKLRQQIRTLKPEDVVDAEPPEDSPPPEEPEEDVEEEQPLSAEPSDEQPLSPEPSDEQPLSPEPSDEQPLSPEPSDEQPLSPEPSDEQPSSPESSDEQPSSPESSDEQPITPESSDEQPAAAAPKGPGVHDLPASMTNTLPYPPMQRKPQPQEPSEEDAGEEEADDMEATPVNGLQPITAGGFPDGEVPGATAQPDATPTDPSAVEPAERPVRFTPAGFEPAGERAPNQELTPDGEVVSATIAEHHIDPNDVPQDLFDEMETPKPQPVEEPFGSKTISDFGPGITPVPSDLFEEDDDEETPTRGTPSPPMAQDADEDEDTPALGTPSPARPASVEEATTEMSIPPGLGGPDNIVGTPLSPEQEEAPTELGYDSAFDGVGYGEEQTGDNTDEEAIVMGGGQAASRAPEYLGGPPGGDDPAYSGGQFGDDTDPSQLSPGVIAPGDNRDRAVVGGSVNSGGARSGIIAPGDSRDRAVVGGSVVSGSARSGIIAPGDSRDRAVVGGSVVSSAPPPVAQSIAPGDSRDRAVVGGSLDSGAHPPAGQAMAPGDNRNHPPESSVSVEGVDDDLVTGYFAQHHNSSMPAVQDNPNMARQSDVSGTRMVNEIRPGFSSSHIIIVATCLTLVVVGLAFIVKVMFLDDGDKQGGAASQESGTIIVTTLPSAACSVSLDTVAKGWLSPGKPLTIKRVDPGDHSLVIVCPEHKQHDAMLKVTAGKISYVEAKLKKKE